MVGPKKISLNMSRQVIMTRLSSRSAYAIIFSMNGLDGVTV
jgi:hypothetical protein